MYVRICTGPFDQFVKCCAKHPSRAEGGGKFPNRCIWNEGSSLHLSVLRVTCVMPRPTDTEAPQDIDSPSTSCVPVRSYCLWDPLVPFRYNTGGYQSNFTSRHTPPNQPPLPSPPHSYINITLDVNVTITASKYLLNFPSVGDLYTWEIFSP